MTKKTLGVFSLAFINFAAIVSLRNLPMMAEYGLASVFFYVLAGLLFFIPLALVAAELATGWSGNGGIYLWVKEAFGPRYGFITIWLEWAMNAVWFPSVLAFAAATAAYVFTPDLAQNNYFMAALSLAVLWGSTIANFFGMRWSGLISSVGSILGTFVPGIFIIGLAVVWMGIGDTSQMSWSTEHLLPDMKLDNLVFFAGVVLGLAGIEMAAFHANEAKDPQKTFPRAIFLATVIILGVSILGSLAIAIVVPAGKISLVAGLMQAFEAFFKPFGLSWLVPYIAAATAIGAFAQISTWVIGPSKGLLVGAQDGMLPKSLQKVNKNGAPVSILIIQAIISTIFSSLYLLVPDVNSAYWMLSDITAQFTVLMYCLIFAAAIRLRYSKPNIERAYKVPGGNAGMWLVAGIGLITCFFTLGLGFVPPANIATGNLWFYETFLIAGILILGLLPPIILSIVKKPSWKAEGPLTNEQ